MNATFMLYSRFIILQGPENIPLSMHLQELNFSEGREPFQWCGFTCSVSTDHSVVLVQFQHEYELQNPLWWMMIYTRVRGIFVSSLVHIATWWTTGTRWSYFINQRHKGKRLLLVMALCVYMHFQHWWVADGGNSWWFQEYSNESCITWIKSCLFVTQ